jgi:hypothetical protein
MNFILSRNPDALVLPNVRPQINEQARLQYQTTHTELTLSENQSDAVTELALSLLYRKLGNQTKENQASRNYLLLLGSAHSGLKITNYNQEGIDYLLVTNTSAQNQFYRGQLLSPSESKRFRNDVI